MLNTFDHHSYNVSETLSPNDTMCNGDLDQYFSISDSAMNCIIEATRLLGTIGVSLDINSILDIPCGYGRVLRSLKAYWPDKTITACDLDRDAVDFCANTFNVDGVYSNSDITKIDLPLCYDVIWCGSLLTHLEATQSKLFLDFLIDKLNANGVLIVTLHGRFCKAVQRNTAKYISDERFNNILSSYNAVGHGYADYEDQNNYGVSIQKPSFTLSSVQDRDDVTVLYFSERRWAGHQDVLALVKKSILDW